MKPKIFTLLIVVLLNTLAYGQMPNIGIGTANPDPSAALEIDSPAKNKGLLLPRVALTSTTDIITVQNPAVGMLVYNTVNASTGNTAVFANNLYQWNGIAWQLLVDSNSFTNLGIPKQVLSANSTLNQQIGSGLGISQLQLNVINSDTFNAWSTSSHVFTVPTGQGGTYIANFQAYYTHTLPEAATWWLMAILEKKQPGGNWVAVARDINNGIAPGDGGCSSILYWTGTLNEGDQLRIMIQTPAQRPTTASIVGLGITKL